MCFRWPHLPNFLLVVVFLLLSVGVGAEAVAGPSSRIYPGQTQPKLTQETPATPGDLPVVHNDSNENPEPAASATKENAASRFRSALFASAPSYYLIWSPGTLQKFLLSLLLLGVVHLCQDFMWSNLPQTLVQNIILPLLSSACCAIQLILNVVGIGCGGFNTLLGPMRPYFLSLLLYLSIQVYPPSNGSESLTFLARVTMALLPELLHVYNTYKTHKKPKMPVTGVQATVRLNVPTMGCVACIHKINSSLETAFPDSRVTGSSWLEEKGGQASITLQASTEAELQALVDQARNAIHGAGFPNTTVEAVVVENKQ